MSSYQLLWESWQKLPRKYQYVASEAKYGYVVKETSKTTIFLQE